MEDYELIKNDIIECFGVDFDIRSREQKYLFPRAMYFALCHKYTRLTQTEIGETLNNKFHRTTVLHAIKTFKDTIIHYDEELKEYFDNFSMPDNLVPRDVDLKIGYIKF